MNAAAAKQFLARAVTRFLRFQSKIDRLDGDLVEQDLAARRQEAVVGLEFAKLVDRIEPALRSIRSNLALDQWCKQSCGCDIATMRRRKRLYKHWNDYASKRRELGACGQTVLLFALSLVKEESSTIATNRHGLHVRSDSRTNLQSFDWSRCNLITGDALIELRKLQAQSVNVIVTSPPYWPAKRAYGGKGVGFEKTLPDYIGKLVAIFHEAHRVLRDDGILWVSIDDSYQDGNLLFISSYLARALQDDGWICRAEVIWSKGSAGRKESVTNRMRRCHEKVLMFTKRRSNYFYDIDPLREPLVGRYSIIGNQKSGAMRDDSGRTERVWSNPMGRNAGSVWEITPSSYQGSHAATMPEELVRRCLSVSCPENALVLDCFGGAGTTALVALQLGHRAISIDIHGAYTSEARGRIARELGDDRYEPDALAAD